MSNLSITNLLSLLQNPAPTQQQVADAANNGEPATSASSSTAAGQNLPTGTATNANGTPANGASTPVMRSDMTAVLLQMQQSQEMSDAQALLYGGAGSSGGSLVDYLDGNSGNTNTTDPTQALMDQLTGATSPQSGSASLMSSNQSLLDYLNAIDTNGPGTTSTNTSMGGIAPTASNSQASANDSAMLDAILGSLDQTSGTPTGTSAVTQPPQDLAALLTGME